MTPDSYDGWCLCWPSGKLVPETFSVRRDDCWGKSFDFLSRRLWMRAYWKQWDESIKAADKRGWKMIRVALLRIV